jgi:glycosyltransferase involved in cell wall biosynthesis
MDNAFKGHHLLYINALKILPFVRDISMEYTVSSNKTRLISYIRDRKRILNYALSQTQSNEILHLLFLDNLYTASIFMHIPEKVKMIGTLHHYPNCKKKEWLLKYLSKRLKFIIVHSEYIGKQLEAIQIRNYIVIDYPAFHSSNSGLNDPAKLREKAGIPGDKVVLSALGGTRYDKGLDILLDSLKYIDEDCKRKLLINIAGKEETFNDQFIIRKTENCGVDIRINLRFMSDEEFDQNIQLSDAIILPYRNVFTGNSGPMAEGVFRNKPIIATDFGNLGFLVNSHRLGYTFQSENSRSLAGVISNFIRNGWSISNKSETYREKLTLQNFLENHYNLYMKLGK